MVMVMVMVMVISLGLYRSLASDTRTKLEVLQGPETVHWVDMNRTWVQIVKITYWLPPDASRALMHLPPAYTPWPASGVHWKFFKVRKPSSGWT